MNVLQTTKPASPIVSTVAHLLVGVAVLLSVLYGAWLALSVAVWAIKGAL